jgi:2,4-diketo-3-deoxy-L-fuconate hydrolase
MCKTPNIRTGARLVAVSDDCSVIDLGGALQEMERSEPRRFMELAALCAGNPPRDVSTLIGLGNAAWSFVRTAVSWVLEHAPKLGRKSAASVEWADVLPNPQKIIGIGHNYWDLVTALGMKPPRQPKLFAKWTTTLIPDGATVVLPPDVREISYEAELAVVIGRGGRDIPRSEALSYVFGYTIANDVTAIDAVRDDGGELIRGKNYDTFLPLGPMITDRDDIPSSFALPIALTQNGVARQYSSTDQMIFDVPSLISFVSRVTTLTPGDIILTGTPAGVARLHEPPAYLRPGDLIEIDIGVLGTLRHTVQSGPITAGRPLF